MDRATRMTLREASRVTARSITTLRRYIRSGKLRADKRAGRFGPEYFLTPDDLLEAGFEEENALPAPPRTAAPPERATPAAYYAAGSVPLCLFQELQMKHEQLLVQYGMVRAGGLRVMELQGEIETQSRQLAESREQAARLREQLAHETARARRAELDLEGKTLEVAALHEKLRGFEILNRNAATSEAIEDQFSAVLAQRQRVERLHAQLGGRREIRDADEPPPASATRPDPEH